MPKRYSRNDPRYWAGSFQKMEALLDRYWKAILAKDVEKINDLVVKVETEAERVGYTNHRRLMALHNAAEKACEGNEDAPS